MKKLILLVFIISSVSSFAQDKIVKKTGEIINCKVTEIAADEVKYYYDDNSKLIFGIDKAKLEKVVFSTGEEIAIKSDSFMDSDYYANQSKNALKVGFLNPLFGNVEIIYERYIKPGRSWEASIGIIGIGVDITGSNPSGVFTKFAYKMIRKPDYYSQRMHYSHILKGAYVAPELALRYMNSDHSNYDYTTNNYSSEKDSSFGLALMIKLGKQWVIEDSFLIDLYFGVGYGFDTAADDYGPMPFGFTAGPPDVPFAMTSGLRLGWVF